MAQPVLIRDVVLRGVDLNFPATPWRSVNRANNLRLIPVALGFVVAGAIMGSLLDPGLGEILAIVIPVVAGMLGFVWATHSFFLGEMKKGYVASPVGASPCDFAFDDLGMKQTSPHLEGAFRWSSFVEVQDTPLGFRFWLTPGMCVMLPAQFVGNAEATALRALIADARARGEIKGPPH